MAQSFRDAMPGVTVRRGDQSHGGHLAPDVDVGNLFWVECKVGARLRPLAALDQAIADLGERERVPMAVCRRDRAEGIVVMRFADVLDFVGEWWELHRA